MNTTVRRVAKECWRPRHECVQRGIVGHFQLQHHDRDDDCDHAIAERDQPVLVPYRRLGRRIAGGANRRPHRQSHTQKMPCLHASDRIRDRGDGYFEPRRAGDDLVVALAARYEKDLAWSVSNFLLPGSTSWTLRSPASWAHFST